MHRTVQKRITHIGLLGEGDFYAYKDTGASMDDICAIAKVQKVKENLFE
ncbi:MAG: hypothetical protein LBI45_03120 [Bacteroidales bacterium]|nr:hypothetical protein [Bacteroidales bacterium]